MQNPSFANPQNTPSRKKLNRASAIAALALSLIALLCVVSGYFQPPQPDEGSAAHIFQISLVLLFPTLIIFLATADWTHPARNARPLILSAAAVTIAFAALFYLEHYR